jgi:O-antigen/teichoic acid export membrane protein
MENRDYQKIFYTMKYPIKETSLLTISSIVTRLFAVMFSVLLAKAFTVSDFGLFRYLLTISSFYAMIFSGIPLAVTKFISANKYDSKSRAEYLTNAIYYTIALFVLSVLVITGISSNRLMLILFVFALVVDYFYLGFLRGLLNYTKLVGFKLLENIIQLVLLGGLFVISGSINFSLAVIFYSFSGLLALIAFEINKFELNINFRSISKERIIELTKYSIPVVAGSIGWTVMFGINTIYLEKYLGNDSVAFYNVGFTLAQVFSFLPEAITTIILPKVAAAADKGKIAAPLKMAVIGSTIISIIILIFLMLFKRPILNILFNENYLPALSLLLPLSIGQIAIAIHQMYAAVFQGLNRPEIPTITISIAAAIQIVCGYFAIHYYGINGAAVSICLTSVVALIGIYGIWLRKGRKLTAAA